MAKKKIREVTAKPKSARISRKDAKEAASKSIYVFTTTSSTTAHRTSSASFRRPSSPKKKLKRK